MACHLSIDTDFKTTNVYNDVDRRTNESREKEMKKEKEEEEDEVDSDDDNDESKEQENRFDRYSKSPRQGLMHARLHSSCRWCYLSEIIEDANDDEDE
jgi:hypothetical protein